VFYLLLLTVRPPGRSRPRWKDGIGMDLRGLGSEVGGWSGFKWLRIGLDCGLLWARDGPLGSVATELVSQSVSQSVS
jgi:hypothetical protein